MKHPIRTFRSLAALLRPPWDPAPLPARSRSGRRCSGRAARLAVAASFLLLAGCGGGGVETGSKPGSDAPAPEAAGDVSYEPAYPEDVSADGLSDEDVAQQEVHAHGGEPHPHGPGEDDHAHGDDPEHPHDNPEHHHDTESHDDDHHH